MVTVEQTLRHQDGILTQRDAAGNQILLHVESGQYYALDEVGSRTWELCDGNRTVSEVISHLSQEYDAPDDTVAADVLELLTDLAHEKLVR